jgi:hypothetical protein
MVVGGCTPFNASITHKYAYEFIISMKIWCARSSDGFINELYCSNKNGD